MRAVVQRVSRASVSVDERITGQIGVGLLLLAGFTGSDDEETLRWVAEKILGLRIFPDAEGRMNRSVQEVRGSVLVVSQFTLYGDVRKGRRPSFIEAARPEVAVPLYQRFLELMEEGGVNVQAGEFGAAMQVELLNDGPVTLIVER
jgi:D-tyrosyl-tRNA(Tyr) deacylase